MRRVRVIPTLLLERLGLVKTVRFGKPKYVGDPINTVKILNDKEVDELVVLDISATPDQTCPKLELIKEIAGECFMPLAYGGGIATLDEAKAILGSGVEKVIVNSAFFSDPSLISEIARVFGSQSVVVSIDCRKRRVLGGYRVWSASGRVNTGMDPSKAALKATEAGAGEILINSIDREGTEQGYDIDLTRLVTDTVGVPVVASGGAGSTADFVEAIERGGASAVAAGSMFVFNGPHRAVLVSYPTQETLVKEVYDRL